MFNEIYKGKFHIYLKDKHIVTNALVDTGNHLYEPLTGKPVCLVEYEKVKYHMNNMHIQEYMWAIPYHTIDDYEGVLWGITADKVIFQNRLVKIINKECIIAFYQKNLKEKDGIEAIIHPDIFE